MPQQMMQEDMQRLAHQITFFKPASLIIVGDLFHSHNNAEHDLFSKWRKDLSYTEIILVKGNHDILPQKWYKENNIRAAGDLLEIKDFIFTHEPGSVKAPGKYSFTGHLHPSITLKGKGRQSLKFPCFYFGRDQAILPAFGRFTGTAAIEPGPDDKVFALTGREVMKVLG